MLVVPDGNFRAHTSWESHIFDSTHVGPFGGHRNAEQTTELAQRWCFWKGMAADISRWVDVCFTCAQFRKQPRKVLSSCFVARHRLPWHHGMVDFEGPITPADRDGFRFIMTYTCLLCHGSLLEVTKDLGIPQVRRAMSRSMFRAKAIPLLLEHDGDQAFTNLCFQELEALTNIEDAQGNRYRPSELAPVERDHQETQRGLGMLLHPSCAACQASGPS